MSANAFLRAAHCDLAKLQTLLAQDPTYLDARGADGETPLGAATHSNQPEIIAFLLSLGVPLDLFAAVVLGRKEAVLTFLREDPGLVHAKATTAHNYPPLYFAAISDQVEMAEILLAHGCDVNAKEMGITPLHGAASFRSLAMVQWLLAHGADVNAWSPFGGTPLHLAASSGFCETVTALLAHGADVSVQTRDSETALALAVERGHLRVVKLLRHWDGTVRHR